MQHDQVKYENLESCAGMMLYITCCCMSGANMLQARMATRVAKPNGQFWLQPDDVTSFMLDKKVSDLPGQTEVISSVSISIVVFFGALSLLWSGKSV